MLLGAGAQAPPCRGSYRDDRFALESIADSLERSAVLREPAYEGPEVGFRVVKVPEPRSALLGLAAIGVLAALRARGQRVRG